MTRTDRFGLTQETINAINSIFNRYGQVEKVLIYGSRAMGNFRPGSDIDLTMVAPTLTMTELLAIENQLDDLLLPYKIDLSLHHQIDNESLLDHIRRVGRVFA